MYIWRVSVSEIMAALGSVLPVASIPSCTRGQEHGRAFPCPHHHSLLHSQNPDWCRGFGSALPQPLLRWGPFIIAAINCE